MRFYSLNKPLSYHLGNFLMLGAVFFLILIYYPFILLYLIPPKINLVQLQHAKGYMIYIPKIAAEAPILPGVDPWNQAEYLADLQHGVAQAKGTSLPGEKGTIYLFAHSSDYPWNITRYNIAFFRLGDLSAGDQIIIYHSGKKLVYKVVAKKTISPTDIQYLKPSHTNQLILQTCTPVGTSLFRLLVFAKRV